MHRLRRFFKLLGPGFITGASDDDPSGIATYAQTGAQFGMRHLWTTLLSFPFMTIVQEMCGRIGMVTGKGLTAVMRKHYRRPLVVSMVTLLMIANTINVGADLGAMASAGQLLIPLPFTVWLLGITAVIILLILFVHYKQYAKLLKYLTLSLFAYIAVAFVVEINWTDVWRGLFFLDLKDTIFDRTFIANMVAVFGTTISPYLFFWQADEEVEEELAKHKFSPTGNGAPHITIRDIGTMRLDTIIGMFFSNFVMFFVMLAAGATLFANGIFQIETADQAALALRPIAGNFATILFALGILGTGFLAVPILSGSASYAFSQMLGWQASLDRPFRKARGFYIVIILSMFAGLLVNYVGIPPFKLLYYTAIANGIASPVLLFAILHIANNKKIMRRYTNRPLSNILGYATMVLMGLAAVALIGVSL